MRNYMKTNGNKYCYFDISIHGKPLDQIVIELFYNDCPKTSDNFLSLCKGFTNDKGENISYRKTAFHRIAKSGYIQGGDLGKFHSNNL